MKKQLIVLAVLAAAGIAHAQLPSGQSGIQPDTGYQPRLDHSREVVSQAKAAVVRAQNKESLTQRNIAVAEQRLVEAKARIPKQERDYSKEFVEIEQSRRKAQYENVLALKELIQAQERLNYAQRNLAFAQGSNDNRFEFGGSREPAQLVALRQRLLMSEHKLHEYPTLVSEPKSASATPANTSGALATSNSQAVQPQRQGSYISNALAATAGTQGSNATAQPQSGMLQRQGSYINNVLEMANRQAAQAAQGPQSGLSSNTKGGF